MSLISEFEDFIKLQITPAIKELEKITSEDSRKHIQKLMFSNLVDRFDVLIDKLILENYKKEEILLEAEKSLAQGVKELDLIRLFVSGENFQDYAKNKIQDAIRSSILRERHSKKVKRVFALLAENSEVWGKPRVNPNTGNILTSFTIQNDKIPHSICGYADWIYSRRNAVVHGGGSSSISPRDLEQITKLFNIKAPSKTFKIQLSSITLLSIFYMDICKILSGTYQIKTRKKAKKKKQAVPKVTPQPT